MEKEKEKKRLNRRCKIKKKKFFIVSTKLLYIQSIHTLDYVDKSFSSSMAFQKLTAK